MNNTLQIEANEWTVKAFTILTSKTTWKILFFLTVALISYSSYRMFISNYTLQKPWISKHIESSFDLKNDLASCLQDQSIANNDATMKINNPDLYK